MLHNILIAQVLQDACLPAYGSMCVCMCACVFLLGSASALVCASVGFGGVNVCACEAGGAGVCAECRLSCRHRTAAVTQQVAAANSSSRLD
jgi:hypothetical protein